MMKKIPFGFLVLIFIFLVLSQSRQANAQEPEVMAIDSVPHIVLRQKQPDKQHCFIVPRVRKTNAVLYAPGIYVSAIDHRRIKITKRSAAKAFVIAKEIPNAFRGNYGLKKIFP